MYEESKLIPGDKIFVFQSEGFPYTPENLPQMIDKNMEVLFFEGISMFEGYNYVCPTFSRGIRCRNIGIRVSSTSKNQDDDFWDFISALRLVRPLPIGISGSFVYQGKDLINSLQLIWRSTLVNCGYPHTTGRIDQYTTNDIEQAIVLYNKIKYFKKYPKRYRRLLHAINAFQEVTLGTSTSYSLIYQGLFNSLEGFFGSPANADKLNKRYVMFLEHLYSKKLINILGKFVKLHFAQKRNYVAHGNALFFLREINDPDNQTMISPIPNNRKRLSKHLSLKKYNDLLKLHEIVRIILLGFLGLDNKTLMKSCELDPGDFDSFFKETPVRAFNPLFPSKKMYLIHPYVSSRKKKL